LKKTIQGESKSSQHITTFPTSRRKNIFRINISAEKRKIFRLIQNSPIYPILKYHGREVSWEILIFKNSVIEWQNELLATFQEF
jgi:hypothetical protein